MAGDAVRTEVLVAAGAGPQTLPRVDLSGTALAARLMRREIGSAQVALVAGTALLLGGDEVQIRVRVGQGQHLTLTEVAGTVAYDARGCASRWQVDIELADGASLAWDGMPFVVCDGADVDRGTRVILGEGARMDLRETLVLGRSGQPGGRMLVRTEIRDQHGPVLVESLTADGAHRVPGVLGMHRVLDTRTRVCGGTGQPAAQPAVVAGATVLHLERGGTITRWLGGQVHESPLS